MVSHPTRVVAIAVCLHAVLLTLTLQAQGQPSNPNGLKATNGKWVMVTTEKYSLPYLVAQSSSYYDTPTTRLVLIPAGDARVRIAAYNGKLVSITGRGWLVAETDDTTKAAVFTIAGDERSRIQFRTEEGRAIGVKEGGTPALIVADVDSVGVWFEFAEYGQDILARYSTKERFAIARREFASGHYRDAYNLYQKVSPSMFAAYDSAALAQYYIEFDPYRVRDALGLNPSVVEQFISTGQGRADYEFKIIALARIEPDRNNPSALRAVGRAKLISGQDTTEAIDLLWKATVLDTADHQMPIELADLLIDRDEYNRVITLLRPRMNEGWLPERGQRLLAFAYRRTDNVRLAIPILNGLILRDSADAWSYVNLMLSYDQIGMLDSSIRLAPIARSHESKDTPPWIAATSRLYLALDAVRQKRYQEALDQLQVGLAVNPDNADLYFTQGDVYAAMKRKNDACLAYGRALEMAPERINDVSEDYRRFGCDAVVKAHRDREQREETAALLKSIDADLVMASSHIQELEQHLSRWRRGVESARNDLARAANQNEEVWSRLKRSVDLMTVKQRERYSKLRDRLEIVYHGTEALAR